MAQTISFTWSAILILISIPYAQYSMNGGFSEKIPLVVKAYTVFWMIVAIVLIIAKETTLGLKRRVKYAFLPLWYF